MIKVLVFTLLALVVGAITWWMRGRPGAAPPVDFQALSGDQRVAVARKQSGAAVKKRFTDVELPYPPREVFLRAFKREAEIEVWAREDAAGPMKFVTAYKVLAASGRPGPKRREGDLQVPEGFYKIDRYNPESSFHLSLGIDYPNEADRILGDRERPGFDIFIHGKDVTVGCMPIGDGQIEELYLLAFDTHQRGQQDIPVHIFPAHMSGGDWDRWARQQMENNPALGKFWPQLLAGYKAFESDRVVPTVTVGADGAYKIAPGK